MDRLIEIEYGKHSNGGYDQVIICDLEYWIFIG